MVDSPQSLRILCTGDGESVFSVRGSALSRIDAFISSTDLKQNLFDTLDDGLTYKQIMLQRTVDGKMVAKNAFSYRIEQLDGLLKNEELQMAYQPIVDPHTKQAIGYEALSRPSGNFKLNPQDLFQAAVETGRIWDLGRLVRKRIAQTIDFFPEDSLIFINLHPAELEDPELIAPSAPLKAYANRIVYEITERTPITHIPSFQQHLRELRKRGYRVAIDDLGAGHANFSSLALLEPDFVKIDMELVRSVHTSPRRLRLLGRLVDMANEEGIFAIAEGIETEEEANAIRELGCHYFQGFLFGRATIPVAKITKKTAS
ncbi:MAG: EAL domain-containing protein [Myxococcales bacterium]|nr:MAG: EAL domain-containing protein [Myxococcales bacterium]